MSPLIPKAISVLLALILSCSRITSYYSVIHTVPIEASILYPVSTKICLRKATWRLMGKSCFTVCIDLLAGIPLDRLVKFYTENSLSKQYFLSKPIDKVYFFTWPK